MIANLQKIKDRLTAALDLRDLFAFAGLALVGVGLWEIYWPLALIVVGVVLLWLGVRR